MKDTSLQETSGFYECDLDFEEPNTIEILKLLSRLKHTQVRYKGIEVNPKNLVYMAEYVVKNECTGACTNFDFIHPDIMNCFENINKGIGYMYEDQLHFFKDYIVQKNDTEYELKSDEIKKDLMDKIAIYFDFCEIASLDKYLHLIQRLPKKVIIKRLDYETKKIEEEKQDTKQKLRNLLIEARDK